MKIWYSKSAGFLGQTNMETEIRYVPVGDSYTKGEGATREESWPVLLTKDLRSHGVVIELVANPSRTGWLTKDVLELELPIFEKSEPNFATLLIGVNDWVQDVGPLTFTKNLQKILDRMQKKLPDPKRLILLTIPDFSVTPTGEIFGEGKDIVGGISSFNNIIKEEADKRDLRMVDVFPLSQEMRFDSALVAPDGLHPSAKAYSEWEKLIFPAAYEVLTRGLEAKEI